MAGSSDEQLQKRTRDPSSTSSSLSCPVWVQFIDPNSGQPYFFNVKDHTWAIHDPDPVGKLCLCPETGLEANGGHRPGSSDEAAGELAAPQPEVATWRSRPARVQQVFEPSKAAYTEGSEQYNIWFGKYDADRFEPKDREPASTRCNPEMDSGFTQADLMSPVGGYFCIYFAQGCCHAGHRCNYYHHLPTAADSSMCELSRDIFGRVRYAHHRDDMDGVGSFNSDARTLFVGDLRFDRSSPDTVQKVEKEVLAEFGVWGEIEHMRIIASKAIGFVRYRTRASAEFAKVSMANQRLGMSPCIRVRWAAEDRNPRAAKRPRPEGQLG